MNETLENVTCILCAGGIGVMPTDTIYGLVARAHDKEAVEKIYTIKERVYTKPCIVLIAHVDEMSGFGVTLSQRQKSILRDVWYGKRDHGTLTTYCENDTKKRKQRPVSVILPCACDDTYAHIHRGHYAIGFRLIPEHTECAHSVNLRKVMEITGPLIATSANPSGSSFAQTIDHAHAYFGDACDFYIEASYPLGEQPSMIIKLVEDGYMLVRA